MTDDVEELFQDLSELITEISVVRIADQIMIGDLKEWCDDMQYGLRVRLNKLKKAVDRDG